MYFNIFENKAYLLRGQTQSSETDSMIKKDLFTEFSRVLIISAEVRGNDLAVNYIYFNSFARANLENVNFKNASLWHAKFYQANLTNADLSGADLRNAFLGSADLSNANLSNAILTGANLSGANLNSAILDGAILSCKNHPVCVPET